MNNTVTKKNVEDISTIDELNVSLAANADEAEALLKKSLDLSAENTQEFIDWQDRLNAVSLLPE
jgi:hypothetical protein